MSNSDHFECHSNFWPKAFWPDLECQEFGRISVSYSISCDRCKTGLEWQEQALSPPITFSSYFSTPMQCKVSKDNLLSYLPTTLPPTPLPTSQCPRSTNSETENLSTHPPSTPLWTCSISRIHICIFQEWSQYPNNLSATWNSCNKDTVAFCKCECPDLMKQLIFQGYVIFICTKCIRICLDLAWIVVFKTSQELRMLSRSLSVY